jgi:tetratricopeptide (TPR) repeat protein
MAFIAHDVLDPAAAAEEKEGGTAAPKFSKNVAKALKPAQEAIQKKQWDVAYAKLKEAEAVPDKTPEEEYWINQFLASVLMNQKKYTEVAPVMEKLVNSGRMPPAQSDDFIKGLAGTYFQMKDYAKSQDYAKRWLKNHPNDPEMTATLGQAQYLAKDFKGANQTMSQLISATEKSGQTPKEVWLQIQMSSVYSLDSNNKEALADSLHKLVRYYPKPEHWDNLLQIASRKDMPDKVKLAMYRLMIEVGAMKTKDQYGDMAELALSAGVPADAERAVEIAYKQNLVPEADKARFDRRLNAAKKANAEDVQTLPRQAKEAEASPQGQLDIALGQVYMSQGKYEDAVAALQRGIKKGGLKDTDEAQIDLGMALYKKNQRDQAKQAFKAVGKDSKWADLADLWQLKAGQSA